MSPWIPALFAAIDRMDADAFVSYIEPNGSFTFGNGPAAVGTEAIRQAVGGFFLSIGGLKHSLRQVWEVPGHALVQGEVTYTRQDGSRITLPFFDVFALGASGKIAQYLIYMDVNPLFAPTNA